MDDFDKIKNLLHMPKGLTFLGIGSILSTAISGIFWLLIARFMDADIFGQLTYFISIAMISTTICLIGGTTSINVFSSKNLGLQKLLYFLNGISSVIGGIVIFLMFESLATSLYVIGYLFFVLVINEMLGKRMFKTYSYILIFQKILMVILAVSFYFILDVEGVILGIALSFVPFIYKIFSTFKEQTLAFSKLRTQLGFLLHNQGLELSSILNTQMDKILIVPLLGFSILGNYSLSFQIISLSGLIPGIIFQYTLPHDAIGITKPLLKKITIISSVFVTFLVIILAPILLPYFFPNYFDTILITQILSLMLIPSAFTLMFHSKFLGSGKSKFVLFASCIQLFTLIVGIILLGETLGIVGATIAVVLGRIFQATFLGIMYKFNFKNT